MIPRQEHPTSYDQRYEDTAELWAREEYASAERAAGLMAKKTWLMFWNEEIPNNKSFAFLQGGFASLRWLPVRWVVLLVLFPAGFGSRGDTDAATRSSSCPSMPRFTRRPTSCSSSATVTAIPYGRRWPCSPAARRLEKGRGLRQPGACAGPGLHQMGSGADFPGSSEEVTLTGAVEPAVVQRRAASARRNRLGVVPAYLRKTLLKYWLEAKPVACAMSVTGRAVRARSSRALFTRSR